MDRDLHRVFLRMARQIVAGMTYLAGMQFVHRVRMLYCSKYHSDNTSDSSKNESVIR